MESDDSMRLKEARNTQQQTFSSVDKIADTEASAAAHPPPQPETTQGRAYIRFVTPREGSYGVVSWVISVAVLGTAAAIVAASSAIPSVRPFAIYVLICVGVIPYTSAYPVTPRSCTVRLTHSQGEPPRQLVHVLGSGEALVKFKAI